MTLGALFKTSIRPKDPSKPEFTTYKGRLYMDSVDLMRRKFEAKHDKNGKEYFDIELHTKQDDKYFIFHDKHNTDAKAY